MTGSKEMYHDQREWEQSEIDTDLSHQMYLEWAYNAEKPTVSNQ